MPYKIEVDKNSKKFKLYNTDKKTYAKREFNSRQSAEKMAEHYSTFGKKTKERLGKKEPKVKEEKKEPKVKEEEKEE